jgi:hydroxymethylglutaryl-CoA lyase
VASEDVLYLLNGLGIETGIDLDALAATGTWITQAIGRPNRSKVGVALASR